MHSRRGQCIDTRAREANLRDVAEKIYDRFRDWDITERLVNRIKKYLKTKNNNDDLSPADASQIYRRDDYGETRQLSKKRRLDINWSDHAEYRSDLRDVSPEKVNTGILEWLRDRLQKKGPDSKTIRMKLPGTGTAVVDYNLRGNPADAKVITVWASEGRSRRAMADRITEDVLIRHTEAVLRCASASGFMSDYNSKTQDNPVQPEMRVWSYADKGERLPMVLTDITKRRWGGEEVIWLNSIFSPEKQGTGIASYVLKQITKMADANDAVIWLSPKPFGTIDNALSKAKLTAWYKRNGWEKEESGSMVRRPR